MLGSGITGIILAGGESKRFGENKTTYHFEGIRLIDRALDLFSGICSSILVSSNRDIIIGGDSRIVHDIRPGKGPMMGIYSALLQSETMHNFVLSVDSPLIPSSLFEFIFLHRDHSLVAVPQFGESHFEPLIGYYSRDCLPYMDSFINSGNLKLPDFFKEVPFKGIDVVNKWKEYQPGFFLNINTKNDISGLYTGK